MENLIVFWVLVYQMRMELLLDVEKMSVPVVDIEQLER